MRQHVGDLMTTDVVSLSKDASLRQAGEAMRDRNIGDVVVRTADGNVCGVVTDRDIVVRGIARGLDPDSAVLDDVCAHHVVSVSSKDQVKEAIRLMEDNAIRRLPVVDDNQLVGILSLGDLAEERDPQSALGEISSAPPNN